VLGGTANVAEQTRSLEALAVHLRARGAIEAEAVGALPTAFAASALPSDVAGEPVLGLADDTLAPIGFEPVGTFAITGPPQSGKTTAMRAVIDAVRRHDPDVRLFHLAGRRAALTGHADWMRSAATFLVGDADVANLSSGFGFVGDFKAGRRGVALKPDAYDGDAVFKTPFPKVRRSDFPEGRGFFVQNGRATLVQLPHVG
jgi:S-DNA-T family DNA segregation ATPase FtsK/SpoIIIE